MLSICGKPYDTLHGIIGLDTEEGMGSLKRILGVKYKQVELNELGKPDLK
jgi:Cystathionine beta-lyase family protein involved in aluminum resistance